MEQPWERGPLARIPGSPRLAARMRPAARAPSGPALGRFLPTNLRQSDVKPEGGWSSSVVPFKIVDRNISEPFESMMEEFDKSAVVITL